MKRHCLTRSDMLADAERNGDESPDEYAESVRMELYYRQADRYARLLLHSRPDDYRTDAVGHDAIGRAATRLRQMRHEMWLDSLPDGTVVVCHELGCEGGYDARGRECPACEGVGFYRVRGEATR